MSKKQINKNEGVIVSSFFLKQKPLMVVNYILNNPDYTTKSRIAKSTDITFHNVSLIVSKYERLGLVTQTKEGREKIVKMTKKGKELFLELMTLDMIARKKE